MTPLLVTGAAGFIGYHVALRCLEAGRAVVGLDNMNAYYDVSLKEARLRRLRQHARFRFERMDLAEGDRLAALFRADRFEHVVHLAAQAGVRHSMEDPHVYVRSNVEGFLNVLEGCRTAAVRHLLYASSSSVYGATTRLPYSVSGNVDHPLSVYAATKKANELLAHCYSHLHALPTTGLRFFTVYGPWGRPDMAVYRFTRAILADEPIPVFNGGAMARDFTYVDDVAAAVVRLIDEPARPNPAWDGASPDPASSTAPYRVYNIGNSQPVGLIRLIEVLEEALGRSARLNLLPMQPGDVPATCADVDDLARVAGFAPSTPIEAGIERFVHWYRAYHREPTRVPAHAVG